MRAQFSEFSYGFAVTREVANIAHSQALEAPVLPSLVQEGSLGWDAKFQLKGVSLFLQYKTSDWLSTARASHWNYVNGPYFRFPVYRPRDSRQHNLLVTLATKEDNVHYCAPMFHRAEEFNLSFFHDEVLKESVWISAKGLPLLSPADVKYHHLLYTRSHQLFWATDPEPLVGISNARDGLENLLSQLETRRAPTINLNRLRDLWSNVSSIAAQYDSRGLLLFEQLVVDEGDPTSLVGALRHVLDNLFGVVWLVVTEALPGESHR